MIVLAAAVSGFAAPARAGTINLLNSGDAYVTAGNASANFGGAQTLLVGPAGTFALLRYDVAPLIPLPIGQVILSATLTLPIGVTTAGSFDVMLAGSAWVESTVTFATAPFPGGMLFTAVSTGAAGGHTLTLDFTNTVKSWVDNPSLNNGIMLEASSAAPGTVFTFSSKEADAPAPILQVVTGSPVPEPASVTLVALGLTGLVAGRRRRRKA